LAVRAGDHSEPPEALVDQLANVVRADAALDRLADGSGNLLVGALSVCGLRDQVEQRRKLDDLSVRPARDVRGLFEPGALVLADQLDAVRELRLFGRPALRGRGLAGYRKDFCSLVVCGGNRRLPLDT
jgi:hypothetical protein